MPSRLSILISLTLLHAACSPDDKTTTDTDPRSELPDGGPSAATEDLTVVVYEPRETPLPLEGAVIGLSQDGVVSMGESDAEGRATFAINPDGGPITASAYLPGHAISSVVGHEPAALLSDDALLPLYMLATTADVIRVSGEVQRPEMDVMQTVLSSTAGSLEQGQSDRFVVPALRGAPFVLTAYQQKIPAFRHTPSDGMRVPMISFRTLKHAGSARDLDVRDALWTELDIANHTVRVTRPRAPAALADDDAGLLRVMAMGTDSDSTVLVADTTALAPWFGQTSYEVTMSGRADLMASTDLSISATLAAYDGSYSTVNSHGALPTSIDVPFLPPPEVITEAPRQDQPFSWDAGDASVWTFLYASVGSELWSVGVLPGISSLDTPALLATLPTAPFRGRDLTARLLTCESEEGTTACLRTAYSAPFTIDAGATK